MLAISTLRPPMLWSRIELNQIDRSRQWGAEVRKQEHEMITLMSTRPDYSVKGDYQDDCKFEARIGPGSYRTSRYSQ
jgi:hypothetical protein